MKSSGACTAVATLALFLTSCVQTRPSAETEAAGKGIAFPEFVEGYFDSYYNFYPTQATAAGLHHYDTRLEPWTSSRIQNRIYDLKRQETSLEDILQAKLTEDDRIDGEILLNRIRGELLDLESIRWWRRNPVMYAVIPEAALDSIMKREYAAPKERLRAVIERMKQIPGFIEAMRNNTTEVPTEFAEVSLRVVKGSIPFFRETLPAWAKQAAGNDGVIMADFTSALRKVVASVEVAAEYLKRDVLFLATPGFSIGASAFSRKLSYEELVDTPVEKLLEIGEANLAKDLTAFAEAARRVDGSSPAQAMRNLNAQAAAETQVVQAASASAEKIRQFVAARKIVPLPSETRPKVLLAPPYVRPRGLVYMDAPGGVESNSKQAFYYISPPEPDWPAERRQEHLRMFNRHFIDFMTMRVVYPGHYVQVLHAKDAPTRTRKLVSCATSREGWGHYAEQMLVEEGYGEADPKVRLAQLAEALVRDVRLVAAIRIHTQGMSADQAKQLFMDKAFLEERNAIREAGRGVYDPMYLSYTLGKLQIYKLRSDYQKSKGSAYSLAGFHEQFLKQGAIPVKLVRRILLPGDTSPEL